ncbi:serine/threonine protein kinase [Limnoglobus roseus]|uniref:Serine/threonine protein kinase n=1 Tax=Limnoglobus roseus TaxID=2598579 RepID=A0A5C1APB6_9BACT|nr:serine/threonine-protein kinase [Limnoglobus roseus]QEL19997.1 serine/threonine protein kinase [Limnoglobus roseus]
MNTERTLPNSCPKLNILQAFLHGHLEPLHRQSIAVHLSHCDSCTAIVQKVQSDADAANGVTGPVAGAGELRPLAGNPPGGLAHTIAFLPAAKRMFIGTYRLGEHIGQGGMGEVYRAEHIRLRKWFAIKILPEAQGSNHQAVGRFNREMEVIGQLNHPNIVRATDAGESEGRHYLVMELIDGVDLAKLVREAGPLPVADACEIIRQAALGLQHAHEHGLVHRDIKPHNLMLTTDGGVKVLDLGLAFFLHARPLSEGLTWNGQVMGTPPYMAPEQWRDSHAIDIRADLYSLGCTLYYLLTGRPPIDSTDSDVLLRELPKRLADVRPDLPRDEANAVDELLARLLAKDPTERPQTPADLACELTPLAAETDLTQLRATSFRLRSQAQTGTPLPSPIATRKQTTRKPKVKSQTPGFRRRLVPLLPFALLIAVAGAWWAGYLKWASPIPQAVANTLPEGPVVGKWFDLLDRKPGFEPPAFHWEDPFQRGHRWFDPDAKQLGVQTIKPAMISLGRVDQPNYTLKFILRQNPWTGNVGVFYGGQTGGQPGEIVCETIEMRQGPKGLPRDAILHREKHIITRFPNRNSTSQEIGFASAPIPPVEVEDHTLEVRVLGDSVHEVLWDGVIQKPIRTMPKLAGLKIPYAGEFGLYAQNCAATLVSAELLLTR